MNLKHPSSSLVVSISPSWKTSQLGEQLLTEDHIYLRWLLSANSERWLNHQKNNETIINTTVFVERKGISALAISHPFLKSSLLLLHRPTSRSKFPRDQPQTDLTASLLFLPQFSRLCTRCLPAKPPLDPICSSEEGEPAIYPSTLSHLAVSGWIQDPLELVACAPFPLSRVVLSQIIWWCAELKSPGSLKEKQNKTNTRNWTVVCGLDGRVFTNSTDHHPQRAVLGTSFRSQD